LGLSQRDEAAFGAVSLRFCGHALETPGSQGAIDHLRADSEGLQSLWGRREPRRSEFCVSGAR